MHQDTELQKKKSTFLLQAKFFFSTQRQKLTQFDSLKYYLSFQYRVCSIVLVFSFFNIFFL